MEPLLLDGVAITASCGQHIGNNLAGAVAVAGDEAAATHIAAFGEGLATLGVLIQPTSLPEYHSHS